MRLLPNLFCRFGAQEIDADDVRFQHLNQTDIDPERPFRQSESGRSCRIRRPRSCPLESEKECLGLTIRFPWTNAEISEQRLI